MEDDVRKAFAAMAEHRFRLDGQVAALATAVDLLIAVYPDSAEVKRGVCTAIEKLHATANGEGTSDGFLQGLDYVLEKLRR